MLPGFSQEGWCSSRTPVEQLADALDLAVQLIANAPLQRKGNVDVGIGRLSPQSGSAEVCNSLGDLKLAADLAERGSRHAIAHFAHSLRRIDPELLGESGMVGCMSGVAKRVGSRVELGRFGRNRLAPGLGGVGWVRGRLPPERALRRVPRLSSRVAMVTSC